MIKSMFKVITPPLEWLEYVNTYYEGILKVGIIIGMCMLAFSWWIL